MQNLSSTQKNVNMNIFISLTSRNEINPTSGHAIKINQPMIVQDISDYIISYIQFLSTKWYDFMI